MSPLDFAGLVSVCNSFCVSDRTAAAAAGGGVAVAVVVAAAVGRLTIVVVVVDVFDVVDVAVSIDCCVV